MLYKNEWVLPEYENNLRKLRELNNLSIVQMARLLNISTVVYRQVELGTRAIYNKKSKTPLPWINSICTLFHCKLEDIFPREVCNIVQFDDEEQFIHITKIQQPELTNIELCELSLDCEKILHFFDNYHITRYRVYRKILHMYYFQDMSCVEISKVCWISEAYVHTLIADMLKILIKHFKVRNK